METPERVLQTRLQGCVKTVDFRPINCYVTKTIEDWHIFLE